MLTSLYYNTYTRNDRFADVVGELNVITITT